MPSYAPYLAPGSQSFSRNTVAELTAACVSELKCRFFGLTCPLLSVFERQSLLVACDPRLGYIPFMLPILCSGKLTEGTLPHKTILDRGCDLPWKRFIQRSPLRIEKLFPG